MAKMTVLKQKEITNIDLKSVGIRTGADEGTPKVRATNLAPNAPGKIGIWECTTGSWPVTNRTDTEVCYILSGKAELIDDNSGESTEIAAGDLIILPTGWTGRWRVTESVTKIFVIYE